MCKIMDPTEEGVWWKDDTQWVLYSPLIASRILTAKKKGDTNITVGPLKSSRHPSGTSYVIDLVAMKQKNLSTGFSRDIKIVSPSSDQEEDVSEEEVEDAAFVTPGRVPHINNIINRQGKEAAGKDIVSMVPSITVDLQELSSRCAIDDHCNLVLKLPKTLVQSDRINSLTRKTLALLLEKLTTKDFIKSVVASKMQSYQDTTNLELKISGCKSYLLGRAQNPDMYSSFLNYLVSLAEEEEGLVDALFSVAEKGSTGEGDRVEYLFRSYSPNEARSRSVFEPAGSGVVPGYSRLLPSPIEGGGIRVCAHLTLSHFVQGKRYLKVVKGATLPVAHLVGPTEF